LNEPVGLSPYVLDLIVERVRDHAASLADFAARLDRFAPQVLGEWADAYKQISEANFVTTRNTSGAIPEDVVRDFFSGLRYSNVRQAFVALQEWTRQLAMSSLTYDGALRLTNEYQRRLLPILLNAYTPGPEMQLVFPALDELFDGIRTLISTAYIEAEQTRLAEGSQYRIIGQLTGGAAHSLNDALAAILGRAQLLQERVNDDSARAELEAIGRSATMGAMMMRRLQDFARADSQVTFGDADVNLLLRDAAEVTRFLWRDETEVQGLFIDVVRDFADVPPVHAQPGPLRRAFVELLLNAIEAMPHGGVITLRTERKENNVLLSIIDSGDGMSPIVRQRMFDPFFTTKGSPHMGLGLTTVAKIIAEQNGTWDVETEPDHGTTITLTLAIAPHVLERKLPVLDASQALNILVVDNEHSVRDTMSRLLTAYGYTVVTAENGSEGISEFRRGKFTLVFTDLGMPGMSGWEVAKQIKKINPKTVVVLMSGWAVSLDPRKAREFSVDRILQKPFAVEEVMQIIAESSAVREALQ
jgi:signal transduction histidine kinase/ActR/RegA family two-component response regulator